MVAKPTDSKIRLAGQQVLESKHGELEGKVEKLEGLSGRRRKPTIVVENPLTDPS